MIRMGIGFRFRLEMATGLLFVLVLLSSLARGEDWPRWGGPRGDGTWRGPKLPAVWPEGKLPVVWNQPIGGGYGGVTVVDGRTFVMDRQAEPPKSSVSCVSTQRRENWSGNTNTR